MNIKKNTPIDISVQKKIEADNPFYVDLYGEFISDEGENLVVPGFYSGNDTWTVRFSAPKTGKWKYKIQFLESHSSEKIGELVCIDAEKDSLYQKGALRVHKENSRYFQHENGMGFIMNAYECNWLFSLWMSDEEKAKSFIKKLASFDFNVILMNVYAHDCLWTQNPNTAGIVAPPPLFAWKGSNDLPDHQQLNIEFFEKFDSLISFLCDNNIFSHMYLFVYNKYVSLPKTRSKEEKMYIKQIMARYQSFPNMLWDFAKESYYMHPKKDYLYEKLKEMRSLDAYKRLITMHDYKVFMHDPKYLDSVDYLTIQQHQDIHLRAIADYKITNKPVFHSEFGYESGVGGLHDRTFEVTIPLEIYLRRAYEALMAGSGICYYYTFTAWDVIRIEDTPPGYSAFQRAYKFFTSLDWWNYAPEVDTCFWTPTMCYSHKNNKDFVICTSENGRFLFKLDIASYHFEGIWHNMMTGETKPLESADFNECHTNPRLTVFNGPYKIFSLLKFSALMK